MSMGLNQGKKYGHGCMVHENVLFLAKLLGADEIAFLQKFQVMAHHALLQIE